MTAKTLHLDDQQLAQLLSEGEGAQTEFKEKLGKETASIIQPTICAFANDIGASGQPGLIAVGIKDDGTAAGISVTDQMLRELTGLRSDGNIVPPPALLVAKRSFQNQQIAVVTVLPSDSPPVRYKGTIHVRNGPRMSTATAQEERILNERRRHRDAPFDIRAVPGTAIDDLIRRKFEDEYLPKAVDRDFLLANNRSFAERLAAAKMIESADNRQATILGLLVLGIQPRDFIPGAYVQFLRIAGTDLAETDKIVDAAEFDGTLSETLGGLESKLQSYNRRQVNFVNEERERRTDIYPMETLRQLVRNAIMHRSYENTNAPVRVTWFDDRIEIQNSGGPFGDVNKENFAQPDIADYRNPNLAEAMKVLGYVQKFGVGILTAQKHLQEAGQPPAEFKVTPTHVFATVRTACTPKKEQ